MDNGSTDDSAKILAEAASSRPWLRVATVPAPDVAFTMGMTGIGAAVLGTARTGRPPGPGKPPSG